MFKTLLFLCIICGTQKSIAGPLMNKYQHYSELRSVKIFQEYLRIDTSDPKNIQHAVDFWVQQLLELKIPYAIYNPAGMPILVATIQGSESSLPSIMLNSHMDVVKADPTEWDYPPFDAHMDSNGDIYARGAQDTKDVAVQYLEAIRKLKKDNVTLTRTIHITFMPDEETGGFNGIKPFISSQNFKSLNVGFALDEGFPSNDDSLLALYVDKRPWQMQFVIHGEGGHGFEMPKDNAMEKMQKFINTVMAFRETQIINTKNDTYSSEYTSLNINVLRGGLGTNIIPSKLIAVIDMRLAPQVDVAEMEALVQSWMDTTGNMTELVFIRKDTESRATAVDHTNPYWVTMKNTLNHLGLKVNPIICPATSDMLVIRNLGIPAIGFSTKTRTVLRAHGKNEYQNAEIFVKGIEIYAELIKNLANVPHSTN